MKLPKAIRGQTKKIIVSLVVFLSIFFFTNATDSGLAQEDSSSAEKNLVNALPRQTDLKPGIEWVLSPDYYSNMQQLIGDAGVMWHGKTGRESYSDDWTCRVRASCSWFDRDYAMGYEHRKSPEGFQNNMINLYPDRGQVYPDLPGGVVFHLSNYKHLQSYEIFFWKSPEYTGRIMVEGPPDIIDSRAEAERLAKLIYSRLPAADGTIPSVINPDGDHATGILPAGNNPGQDGSNTLGSTPGSSLSGADLSAGALFAAVGLTALVTLFGSVGVALTNGMSLQGAWSELTAFFGNVIPGNKVELPPEAEQAIYPEETLVEKPEMHPRPPDEEEGSEIEVEPENIASIVSEEAKLKEPDVEQTTADSNNKPQSRPESGAEKLRRWEKPWKKYLRSFDNYEIDQEDLVALKDWFSKGVNLEEIELRHQMMLAEKKQPYEFYKKVIEKASDKVTDAVKDRYLDNPVQDFLDSITPPPVKIASDLLSSAEDGVELLTAWVESKDPVQMRPVLNEFIFSYDLSPSHIEQQLSNNFQLRGQLDHHIAELKKEVNALQKDPRSRVGDIGAKPSYQSGDPYLKHLDLDKKVAQLKRLEAKRYFIDQQDIAYSKRLRTGWPGK
jgi:hypothetical protein